MNKNKRVVVIGGSGFLGSHLADSLADNGFEVTIYDMNPSPWLRDSQRFFKGNILDFKQLCQALQNARFVYHLAGEADIGQAAKSPRETIEKNIIGSTNIIEACIAQKVERLLFASTVYVYSDRGSFYRVSKQAVESLLEAYQEASNLQYTILRFGSLYGPRAQEWNGLKRWVLQAVKEGKIVYPGTGTERREYIHVKDAAELSVKTLLPEYANQCLTITGTQVMSVKEVLNMISEILGKKLEINFSPHGSNYELFHYSLTPYRYTPRQGKKIVPSCYIDIGQGLLDLIEESETPKN